MAARDRRGSRAANGGAFGSRCRGRRYRLLLAIAASAAGAPEALAGEEPVGIIDLRGGDPAERRQSRRELEEALRKAPELAPVTDPALAAALAGEEEARAAAEEQLARAAAAYGKLDCDATGRLAGEAVLAWAALQSGGDPDAPEALRQAETYAFLCAHRRGDLDAAMRAAQSLRRLGGPLPPGGVSAEEWQRYPALDATASLANAEVTVKTEPAAGAEVWIDLARVGASPARTVVPHGEHVVAAGRAGAGTARRVEITGPAELALTLPDPDRWQELRTRVARQRAGGGSLRAEEMGALLAAAGVRAAIVLRGSDLEVWGATRRGRGALPLGTAAGPLAARELIAGHVAALDRGPGLDPDRELLREAPGARAEAQRGSPQKWWVYAALAGAAALGLGAILVHDAAADRQRFELTLP